MRVPERELVFVFLVQSCESVALELHDVAFVEFRETDLSDTFAYSSVSHHDLHRDDLFAFRGQPDVAVLPTDIVLNGGQAANGVARGNLTVAVRNLGDEPAVGVRVRVYDGAEGPDNLIADFVVGNASDPVKAVGRSEGNFTATRDWSVGRHEILVVADPVAHEDVTGNNRAVAILYVEPGPPDTIVVGAGPYYLALLLGFVIGAAVLFLPLRRLRELRRKEGEKTS